MKIAHLCLSNFYIDEHLYQENALVREHVASGHDVIVIASTENFDGNKTLVYGEPKDYIGSDGARVIRLAYRHFPNVLARKLRAHRGVKKLLEEFRPNVILFHGSCGWELRTAAAFVRSHPHVRLFVDSHEDWNNSARGFISRNVLHRYYYAPILRSAINVCETILCVSTETMEFVSDLYRVDREKLELFPLGCTPIGDSEFFARRDTTRAAIGAREGSVIFIQSGKQTKRKKLVESLEAFRAVDGREAMFLIAGVLDAEIRKDVAALIEADARVRFIGWCEPERLTDLLCAADVYVQPGTQSATMQHSLGCRCAVILDNAPSHEFYKCGNGWYVNTSRELSDAMRLAATTDLSHMAQNSYEFAKQHLNYAKLARRVVDI